MKRCTFALDLEKGDSSSLVRIERVYTGRRTSRKRPRKLLAKGLHGQTNPCRPSSTILSDLSNYREIQDTDASRKVVTVKFKFTDRLTALALLGKACHWYADRQEDAAPDGAPIQKDIVVRFVKPPRSPEEAYRRMVTGR